MVVLVKIINHEKLFIHRLKQPQKESIFTYQRGIMKLKHLLTVQSTKKDVNPISKKLATHQKFLWKISYTLNLKTGTVQDRTYICLQTLLPSNDQYVYRHHLVHKTTYSVLSKSDIFKILTKHRSNFVYKWTVELKALIDENFIPKSATNSILSIFNRFPEFPIA